MFAKSYMETIALKLYLVAPPESSSEYLVILKTAKEIAMLLFLPRSDYYSRI